MARPASKFVAALGTLCSVSAAPMSHAAALPMGATLLINDSDAVGRLGDDLLSFAEAIQLANGSLSLSQLSSAERRHVRGVPGPQKSDRIRFSVKGGAIRFPAQVTKKPDSDFAVLQTKSLMPVLIGNDGDEIDGKGVRFLNGPDETAGFGERDGASQGAPLGGAALVVESSNFTIRNATFERFVDALIFRPAAGSQSMSDVTVINNRFLKGGGIGFTGVSAGQERSALRNVLVEGNSFLGPAHFGGTFPSKLHNAIAVTGATAAVAKGAATAPDVVIEDVRILRNTVRAFAGGVQVQPLQTLFAVNRGAQLSRLVISRNDIALDPEAGDPAIYIWGAVSVNGQATDVKVSGIQIDNNKVLGNGHVLFIAGVEALIGGNAAVRNIHMDDIRVAHNRIGALKSCSHGITTIAAFPEMNGPAATDTSLKNVQIVGNIIDGCTIGAFAAPVLNVGAPGLSSNNEITGINIDSNQVSRAQTGIILAGAALTAEKFEGAAEIDNNRVSGATIRGNRIGATAHGIIVTGAFASGNGDGTLKGNHVELVALSGNKMTSGSIAPLCRIEQHFADSSRAAMTGNQVTGLGTDCTQ